MHFGLQNLSFSNTSGVETAVFRGLARLIHPVNGYPCLRRLVACFPSAPSHHDLVQARWPGGLISSFCSSMLDTRHPPASIQPLSPSSSSADGGAPALVTASRNNCFG